METAEARSGLTAIYLNNSFFRNVLTRIWCERHSNLTGTNSAGKTSILNLIPVFYGLEPSGIISREGGKLSFVRFYLPQPSSMIVFEYLKAGSHNCVILYRKTDEEKLCYRFVEGAADGVIFSEDSLEYLRRCGSVSSWLTDYLSRTDTFVSQVVPATTIYREILFNHRASLNSRKASRGGMVALAQRFSLCPAHDRIEHLGELTSVMVNPHSSMLRQLKTMLVDCYIAPEVSIRMPRNQDASELVAGLRLISALSRSEGRIEHVFSLRREIYTAWGEAADCVSLLEHRDTEICDLLETLRAETEKEQQVLADMEAAWKERQAMLAADIRDKGDELGRRSKVLEDLRRNSNRYEEQDAAAKETEYRDLQKYRDEERRTAEELAKVRAQTAAVTEPLESEKERALNRILRQREAEQHSYDSELTEKKGLLQQAADTYMSEKQKLRERHDQETQSARAAADKENAAFESRITEIQSALGRRYEPTAEEQQTLVRLKKQREDITGQRSHDLSQVRLLAAERRQVQQSRDELKEACRGIRETISALKRQYEELSDLAGSRPGSLLTFLEQQRPEWKEDIAKVINPRLLGMTNLKPEVAEAGGSFFGLELNLDALDATDLLSRIAGAGAALEQLAAELETNQAGLEHKEKDLSEAEQRLTKLNAEETGLLERLGRLETELTNCDREDQDLRRQMEEADTRRKDGLKQQLAEVRSDRQIARARHIQKLQELSESQSVQSTELQAAYRLRKEQLDAEISKLSQAWNARKAEFLQQEQNVESIFADRLRHAGIDPEIVQGAERRAEAASAERARVEGYQTLVEEYRRFMDTEYAFYPQKLSEEQQLRLELSSAREALERSSRTYERESRDQKSKVQSLNGTSGNLKQELTRIRDGLTHERGRFSNRPDDAVSPGTPRGGSTYDFLSALTECLDRVERKTDELKNETDLVRDIFNHNIDCSAGRELVDEIWIRADHSEYVSTGLRYLGYAARLEKVMHMSLPGIRETYLLNLNNLEYRQVYESLRNFNQVVSRQSRRFAELLSLSNPFEELSDIQISLSSKVQETYIYQALRLFIEEYQTWERSGQQLPHERLVEALAQVPVALKSQRIDENPRSLVEMTVSMRENGRLVDIRSDDDLSGVSSRGMSKLAIITIFCGLTRLLCRDRSVTVHWPLDEIGEIANDKLFKLFDMMDSNAVVLLCAQPNPSSALLQKFHHKYLVDRHTGIKTCVDAYVASPDNPLLT